MLIVMHQKPDLDAIASAWLLVRFDNQHYGGSRLAFVPAGNTIAPEEAAKLGYTMDQVTHVDTGRGRFDHHLPERAGREYSATSLVYQYVLKIHPEYATDGALRAISDVVTEIDHFGEVFWEDANNPRYCFMLTAIIDGMDATETNDDSYQAELAFRLLDFIYANLKRHLKALEKLGEGAKFPLKTGGEGLALFTGNEEVLSVAQKAGYMLVVKKDKKSGHIRIKCRPDAPFDLSGVYARIQERDKVGTWYYHPGGKMLLNGSHKAENHVASPLTLDEVVAIIREEL